MKSIRENKIIGTVLFFVLWPFIWFYSPLIVRVRVLIIVKGEILVVNNWFGPNTWQLPGGGKKFGESSLGTAKREILEEVGISKSGQMSLLSEEVLNVRFYGLPFRYQYAQLELKSKPEIISSSEIAEYEWVKLHDFTLPPSVVASL